MLGRVRQGGVWSPGCNLAHRLAGGHQEYYLSSMAPSKFWADWSFVYVHLFDFLILERDDPPDLLRGRKGNQQLPKCKLEFLKKGDGRDNYKNTTPVKIIGWARSGEICVLSLYGIQYMLPPWKEIGGDVEKTQCIAIAMYYFKLRFDKLISNLLVLPLFISVHGIDQVFCCISTNLAE